jgi:hypothetical protein
MNGKDMRLRTAGCGCGNLKAALRGEPVNVYVCSCQTCQRRSGGAFTYAAIFPEPNVTITGERRSWRRNGESGRWIENSFCPTCGISVFFRSEAMAGMIGISVGCLSDAEFPPPTRHYWSSRKHHWLELPADIPFIDTQ